MVNTNLHTLNFDLKRSTLNLNAVAILCEMYFVKAAQP